MAAELILPALIAERARTQPDLDVLTFEYNGAEEIRTYRQLWENALRIAAALRERGVGRGDRFGLLLQNHPEFVECMVAAGILGAVTVPIDPRTKGDKLGFMLGDSGCVGLICGDYAYDNLAGCGANLAAFSWVYLVGSAPPASPGARPVHAFGELLARPVVDMPIVAASETDLMQIMYTSGTTADPKGVMIRHGRFVLSGRMGEHVFGYRHGDRPYTGLSLTHGNAQFVTMSPSLRLGLRAVFSRRFTKSRLWTVMRHYGCTTFSLLGGMATAIYSEPVRPDDADNPVRFVVSAGMPKVIWEEFERRFGLEIFEFYAAMEGGLTIKPIGEGPTGSCGRVAPGFTGIVVDDNGAECAANSAGELWIRPADGSAPVVEYYNNPGASAEKTAGGWLHMGDVVTMDKDGWVYFLYRKGGGIRRNGEFVNAAFLEKCMAEHPDVADVAVFGVPAKSGAPGEMDLVAAIVADKGRRIDVRQIFDWCRSRVEPNLVPSHLMVLPELPKTASEKVQPRVLVEMFNVGGYPIVCE